MKRLLATLGFVFYATFSYCQTVAESSSDPTYHSEPTNDTLVQSEAQMYYTAADSAYAAYFKQKTNPSFEREKLYPTLMDCFLSFCKCMDTIAEPQYAAMKAKIRQLRAEFEEAGIYFSSHGDNHTAYRYLECYLNIPLMPLFDGERFNRNSQYPAYVFIVAAEAHNSRDYAKAVQFLREYIELGEKQNQQICYEFLAADLDILEQYDEEAMVLDEGIMNYPRSLKMIKQAILLAKKRNNDDKAEEMLSMGLALAPDDSGLRLFKASVDDRHGRFADALTIYQEFWEHRKSDVQFIKQLAFCHYNYACALVNESNASMDKESKAALNDSAKAHFNNVIYLLEPLSHNPINIKGDQRVLYALSDAMTQTGRNAEAEKLREQAQLNISLGDGSSAQTSGIPNFNEWYKPRLDKLLAEWELRGEFEPASAYQKRVNPETRKELIIRTRNELERDFISEYAFLYNLDDLTIKPYDPDHQTYKIITPQGDIYLKVPITEGEAKKFKDSWSGVKILEPQFKIDKSGKLLLSKAIFATPYGQSYLYDANQQLVYGRIKIARPVWNDDDFLASVEISRPIAPKTPEPTEEEPINVGESDIDVNIPKTKDTYENVFALIIANEHYKNVDSVPFALKDGLSFRKYCTDVLGIPEGNIVCRYNATGNEMTDAVDRIKDFQQAYEGMKLIVFYSGHGLPDSRTNESYLLPTDASPRNISTGYKLSHFYEELTAYHPANVTVFLDACFSGTKKDGQIMDRESRGVIITPREETPVSNMVVFSACTGNETAYPYANQKHGLFTYFLLKKLQEDKGKTSYKHLAEYISRNVKQQSIRLNGKLQSPTIYSALPESEWGDWRLNR